MDILANGGSLSLSLSLSLARSRARIVRAELPRGSARRFVLTIVNARSGERDVTLGDR